MQMSCKLQNLCLKRTKFNWSLGGGGGGVVLLARLLQATVVKGAYKL